ncbi:FIG00388958: hypothetical protein [hydrothermal vent metagenome]|uniref:Protein kinase domain-containing protein n=1 Tax=hydrothermal vent metagenome TaxID=652676 RepID=A0A1W1BBJ8_9ZZZZ
MKYTLNPKYKNFKPFLLNIKKYFYQNTDSIHKARNELKIITFNGIEIVVKSFKIPNLLRSIIYTFFRDSKAKKSYDNSLKLGDFTPDPIGYIEFYKSGLLADSYFVAKKFDYDFTIREPLLDLNFPDRERVFHSFAKFSFELHQRGILHKDYSPGNILIKKEQNSYIFKVVDVNRMVFKTLSTKERLQNFDKLWAKDDDLAIIIKEYAKLANLDEEKSIKEAITYSQKLKNFKNMKKRLKGKPVND